MLQSAPTHAAGGFAKPYILAIFPTPKRPVQHAVDEILQAGTQIGLIHKPLACPVYTLGPNCKVQWQGLFQRRRVAARRIPHRVGLAQAGRRLQPIEQGLQLGMVRIVVLRIDLPDQCLAGPDGADQ